MLFSVITPAFNARALIGACIESVQRQTERGFEHIVIDDGSVDGTADAVRAMHAEGVRVISIASEGVSAARNRGIEEARGEYLVFLDADDALGDDALRLYRQVIEHSPADVILGGFTRVYPKKTAEFALDTEKETLNWQEEVREFDPFFSRFTGCVWGKCYRRKLVGVERFDTALSLCEDAEFNFRVFAAAKSFVYLNRSVYRYTYSDSSTIRRYDPSYIGRYVRAAETIERQTMDTALYPNFLEFACNVFNVVCFNVIYAEDNTASAAEKKAAVRSLLEDTVFGRAVDGVKLSSLSKKSRAVAVLARRRNYAGLRAAAAANKGLNRLLY